MSCWAGEDRSGTPPSGLLRLNSTTRVRPSTGNLGAGVRGGVGLRNMRRDAMPMRMGGSSHPVTFCWATRASAGVANFTKP